MWRLRRGKKLYEIIKALPETDVRIEEEKSGVKVAADRFDSRMQTLPREDFPTLPDGTGSYSATLPREVLRHMVAKTQFELGRWVFLAPIGYLNAPRSMGKSLTELFAAEEPRASLRRLPLSALSALLASPTRI